MALFGKIAMRYAGLQRPLEVLKSAHGFYIGTSSPGGLPLSRESAEYWDEEDRALEALSIASWTQREEP